jgi:hypothetical protein
LLDEESLIKRYIYEGAAVFLGCAFVRLDSLSILSQQNAKKSARFQALRLNSRNLWFYAANALFVDATGNSGSSSENTALNRRVSS